MHWRGTANGISDSYAEVRGRAGAKGSIGPGTGTKSSRAAGTPTGRGTLGRYYPAVHRNHRAG